MNFPQNPPRPIPPAPRDARSSKNRIRPRSRKIDVPRGGKMDGSVTGRMIAENGMRNSNVLAIGHDFIAARRQKWIDPSQFVNLFLATLEMQCATARSTMNRTDRRAWDKAPRCGAIKTTCYLRTLEASNVEKSTIDVQKVQRGVMATATAATASAAAKAFTEAEKNACSLEAMMNGGECEACQ